MKGSFLRLSFLCLAPLGLLVSANLSVGAPIHLKSRTLDPAPSLAYLSQEPAPVGTESRIVLIQPWETGLRRAELRIDGVELLHYLPEGTWVARVDGRLWNDAQAQSRVRWLGSLQSTDKMPARLAAGDIGDWARTEDGRVELRVRAYAKADLPQLRTRLEALGAEVVRTTPALPGWIVLVSEGQVESIAGLDLVQWVSETAPPVIYENDGTRVTLGAEIVQSPPYNRTGLGVKVGILDDKEVASDHPDFTGRLTNFGSGGSTSHATHVAGTIGGSGAYSETDGGTALQWRGMAPDASVLAWDNEGDVISLMVDAIANQTVDVLNNSWGFGVNSQNCSIYGDYDLIVPDLDALVRGTAGRRVPIVFSAGNERDDGDCGLDVNPYGCLNPPKAAKNILVVGATNSDDDTMTIFSSWGPTDDGRVKPDLCAPGCEEGGEGYIHSTLPPNFYYGGESWCGTSMAAAAATGSIALLRDAYLDSGVPWALEPSMYKALLVAHATDVGNPGTDYAFGHGRINIEPAVLAFYADTPYLLTVDQNDEFEFDFAVPDLPELRVAIAWDDPEAMAMANPALINDIDLVLISPSDQVYEPWVLDPLFPDQNAVRGVDTVNNVESITVANPEAGVWTARVTGTNVPTGPQLVSLAGLDNKTPGPVTDVIQTSMGETSLSWTWNEDRVLDFEGTLIVRYEGSRFWAGPQNGVSYVEGQSVAPGAKVIYSRDEDHSSDPFIDDEGLQPETAYSYLFYSFDDARNFSSEVLIEGLTSPPSSVEGDGPVTYLDLGAPMPNPASGEAVLRFAVPAEADVEIALFDTAGRRVRRLVDGPIDAGRHEVVWDGRDDSGRLVGAGIYFYELRSEGRRLSRQISWRR